MSTDNLHSFEDVASLEVVQVAEMIDFARRTSKRVNIYTAWTAEPVMKCLMTGDIELFPMIPVRKGVDILPPVQRMAEAQVEQIVLSARVPVFIDVKLSLPVFLATCANCTGDSPRWDEVKESYGADIISPLIYLLYSGHISPSNAYLLAKQYVKNLNLQTEKRDDLIKTFWKALQHSTTTVRRRMPGRVNLFSGYYNSLMSFFSLTNDYSRKDALNVAGTVCILGLPTVVYRATKVDPTPVYSVAEVHVLEPLFVGTQAY